jgi:hypothetical protein
MHVFGHSGVYPETPKTDVPDGVSPGDYNGTLQCENLKGCFPGLAG